jgi:hypothetical protein
MLNYFLTGIRMWSHVETVTDRMRQYSYAMRTYPNSMNHSPSWEANSTHIYRSQRFIMVLIKARYIS